MKFVYEYRTSDNVRHDGVISASDREAAFSALKAKGIRPGYLADAPGFFNKLFGKGKRWLAIATLGILCAALAVTTWRVAANAPQPSAVEEMIDSPVRRQLIGDPAVIEKGVRTGWADVFTLEGDRFLASFAIPGVPAAIRNTTEEKLKEALGAQPSDSALPDSIEARQILAIVGGMKREIAALLSSGWTLKEVGAALAKRQDREIGIYQRVENEISAAKKENLSTRELLALWEKKNAELRILGIRLVSMPE